MLEWEGSYDDFTPSPIDDEGNPRHPDDWRDESEHPDNALEHEID